MPPITISMALFSRAPWKSRGFLRSRAAFRKDPGPPAHPGLRAALIPPARSAETELPLSRAAGGPLLLPQSRRFSAAQLAAVFRNNNVPGGRSRAVNGRLCPGPCEARLIMRFRARGAKARPGSPGARPPAPRRCTKDRELENRQLPRILYWPLSRDTVDGPSLGDRQKGFQALS